MICSGPEHSLPMRCAQQERGEKYSARPWPDDNDQLIQAQHRVTKALQLVAEQTARIEHLRAAEPSRWTLNRRLDY
jgi:hypothetical protein